MRIAEAEARALATAAFTRAGVPAAEAADAAEILTLAEMMGIGTHGLSRVRTYVERMAAGGIDPGATASVTAPAPALRLVDARNGLGPAMARRALDAAIEAARETGLGGAFCRRSSHLGALSPYLWIAAEAGFAAIVSSNTAPMIAPAGGRAARIGNNPLGIGLPHGQGRHVLLDMALSVASRSRLRAAADRGEPIPETWATDAAGRPTSDPAAAMAGLMQAIGGPKGAHLALALDLLAGGLSGAAMLTDIPNAAEAPGQPQNLGQMVLLIDCRRLMPAEALTARIDDAARILADTPPVDCGHPPRLPGARAIAAMRAARRDGLDLPGALHADLVALAG